MLQMVKRRWWNKCCILLVVELYTSCLIYLQLTWLHQTSLFSSQQIWVITLKAMVGVEQIFWCFLLRWFFDVEGSGHFPVSWHFHFTDIFPSTQTTTFHSVLEEIQSCMDIDTRYCVNGSHRFSVCLCWCRSLFYR